MYMYMYTSFIKRLNKPFRSWLLIKINYTQLQFNDIDKISVLYLQMHFPTEENINKYTNIMSRRLDFTFGTDNIQALEKVKVKSFWRTYLFTHWKFLLFYPLPILHIMSVWNHIKARAKGRWFGFHICLTHIDISLRTVSQY